MFNRRFSTFWKWISISVKWDPSHELYSDVNKKFIATMKLETASDIELAEAVSFRSNFCTLDKKQNSLHCKHKRVQDQNKYTLEDYKYWLENNENNYGVNYSFRSNRHETSMVKQKKIALITFDDKRF